LCTPSLNPAASLLVKLPTPKPNPLTPGILTTLREKIKEKEEDS
jgi:hypothetical protein